MGVDGAHYTVIIFSCLWNIQLGYHDCCFIICSEVPFYALLNKQFFNPGIWTPPISGFGIDENHRDPEIRDPGLQSQSRLTNHIYRVTAMLSAVLAIAILSVCVCQTRALQQNEQTSRQYFNATWKAILSLSLIHI